MPELVALPSGRICCRTDVLVVLRPVEDDGTARVWGEVARM